MKHDVTLGPPISQVMVQGLHHTISHNPAWVWVCSTTEWTEPELHFLSTQLSQHGVEVMCARYKTRTDYLPIGINKNQKSNCTLWLRLYTLNTAQTPKCPLPSLGALPQSGSSYYYPKQVRDSTKLELYSSFLYHLTGSKLQWK